MKVFENILAVLLSVCLCGCSKTDVYSVFDIGGDRWTYHSEDSFTAVADAGDTLFLGTSEGDVMSFDHVMHEFGQTSILKGDGKMIYKMLPLSDDSIYISVRDGGISRISVGVDACRFPLPRPDMPYNYSAYDFCMGTDGNLYAGTSNGAYMWNPVTLEGHRLDSFSNDVNLSRIYTVEELHDNTLLFAGEAGIFLYDPSNATFVSLVEFPVAAYHDGLYLTKDGSLFKGADKIISLKSSPVDFVLARKYVYVLSQNSVDVIDLDDGDLFARIRFSEQGSAQNFNRSARGFILCKGDHIYIVPDDGYVYCIPLVEYWPLGEVITDVLQIPERRIYALSSSNNLFLYDDDRETVSFVRSFSSSSEVRLAGSLGRRGLLINVDGRYYRLRAPWHMFMRPVRTLKGMLEGKWLWDLVCEDIMYQGWADNIRKFNISNGRFHPDGFISACGELELNEGYVDYYPAHVDAVSGGLLVSTLHNGLYRYSASGFVSIPGYEEVSVSDVQALDAKGKKFVVLTDSFVRVHSGNDTLSVSLGEGVDFNRMASSGITDRFYLYSKGKKGIGDAGCDGRPISIRMIHEKLRIYDDASIGNKVVFGSSHGLVLCDSFSDSTSKIPVYETGVPQYLKAMVCSVVLFLFIFTAATLLLLLRLRSRNIRPAANEISESSVKGEISADDLYVWVRNNYTSDYVKALAEQMIGLSVSPHQLKENVERFKSFGPGLDVLDRISQEHYRIMEMRNALQSSMASAAMAEIHMESELLYDMESEKALSGMIEEFRIICLEELRKPEWDRLLKGARRSSKTLKMFVMMYLAGNNTAVGRYIVRSYATIKNTFIEIMKERIEDGCSHTSDLVSLMALTAYERIIRSDRSI